jgi:diacylglycerol O-acyltransferase
MTEGANVPEAGPIPLGPEDRDILARESATVAGHTCKVMRLGRGAPDAPALRALVAERLHLTPALTRKLGGSRHAPVWIEEPELDLSRHIVEHHPGRSVDLDGLVQCVARLFEQRLDRDHPLWRMDVIELQNDERAVVWRIHHALADGTTSVRYSRALLWDDAPEQTMTRRLLAAQQATDEARRRAHLAGYLRREFVRSRGHSPFDGSIGSRRVVGFSAVPLKPLHDAAKTLAGATINDVVLEIVTGSLRHWVQTNHGHLGDVRVKVPVSLHRERDEEANHDSCFSLGLPLGEPDPVRRLQAIHERTRARKAALDAERREVVMDRLSDVSPRLARFADKLERSPRRFALNVSNVPGPRQPVSVLSAPVTDIHSIAEISKRHALRVSVISFADQLCFGFCADADLVPDVQSMADRVEPEARALLDALVAV